MANLQEKRLLIQNPIIKPTTLDTEHIIKCFGNTEFTKILEQKNSAAENQRDPS